ncbi:MAG: GTP-binding protein [Promethearchaeota archaeon]
MYVTRVALLGDGAVGKTAIRRRYMGEGFVINYQATIGADFASKNTIIDGEEFSFQIWDLAGQPLYTNVRRIYYQGCMGGFAVYDCTRRSTYENIMNWVYDLWQYCGKGKVPVVLLGNKFDLMEETPNAITIEEGNILTNKLSDQMETSDFPVQFYPTSAKTGLNIDEAFNVLGRLIVAFFKKKQNDS